MVGPRRVVLVGGVGTSEYLSASTDSSCVLAVLAIV